MFVLDVAGAMIRIISTFELVPSSRMQWGWRQADIYVTRAPATITAEE